MVNSSAFFKLLLFYQGFQRGVSPFKKNFLLSFPRRGGLRG